MGQRGPAKTPTKLAVLRGERKDRINTNEPQPNIGDVVPPAWLQGDALDVWHELAADLKAKGVLTSWDVEAYARYCDVVVRYRHAAKMLAQQGEVIEVDVFGKNGEPTGTRITKNPWTLVLRDSDAQLQRYAAKFGMTPSDRAGLSIGGGAGDADDDLLTG